MRSNVSFCRQKPPDQHVILYSRLAALYRAKRCLAVRGFCNDHYGNVLIFFL